MARRGVGDPDVESCSLPNSTVVLLSKFSTHKSPEESNAREYGPYKEPSAPALVELIVTAGVGEPEVESWALVSSTTSLVQGVPKQSGPPPVTIHRFPEPSKTSWAPPLEEIVTVGTGFALTSSALGNSTAL